MTLEGKSHLRDVLYRKYYFQLEQMMKELSKECMHGEEEDISFTFGRIILSLK